MKPKKEDLIQIYQNERWALMLIIINFVLSLGFFVFSIIGLNPNSPVVKVGYGDIGGYRDGTWLDMLAFPILAIVFGVLHSFIALRIFHKRGGGMTKYFLLVTTTLIIGTIIVYVRLLKEG